MKCIISSIHEKFARRDTKARMQEIYFEPLRLSAKKCRVGFLPLKSAIPHNAGQAATKVQ